MKRCGYCVRASAVTSQEVIDARRRYGHAHVPVARIYEYGTSVGYPAGWYSTGITAAQAAQAARKYPALADAILALAVPRPEME